MNVEQQYIDLFSQTEAMICKHSAEVLNAPRAAAFADFERLGFPTRKMEKYKYTDISKYFEPDYGLNLNRLQIPVNPYEVFKCDVPNMSTALYFVVNDAFYNKALPKTHLPEGVIFGSLKEVAAEHPELVKKYYGKLADTSKDGVTAFNTTFAQDGVIFYVAVDEHLPARRMLDAGDERQQRGFSAAGRPDDAHKLPVGHAEGHIPQRRHFPVRRLIGHGGPAQLDFHGVSPFACAKSLSPQCMPKAHGACKA